MQVGGPENFLDLRFKKAPKWDLEGGVKSDYLWYFSLVLKIKKSSS